MKGSFADYTEAEFVQFMQEIFLENVAATDERLDALLEHFSQVTGHPDGTDLIYYCEPDTECTPLAITRKVKAWRAANGLPGFRQA